MQSLWLYLHFPHLQLDSVCHAIPSPQQRRVEDTSGQINTQHSLVILHHQTNCVLQLNQAAIDAGIRTGMGLGTAAALDQHLQVLPYKSDIEQKKLVEIAEHLYLVTSDICLFPPNGLLLRIHNMLMLYGGLNGYWRVVKNQLKEFQVKYYYASGQSPYAARILARTAWNQVSDHLPMLQHQIGIRQLTDSELDKKTVSKLARVGIHSLADLMALPLKDVAKRFDIDLVTYLGRLSGEFHHPMDFYHPQSKFQRYLELLYEISHTDTLLSPIKLLLTALEQFLKIRDLLTQKIIFTFYQRDNKALTLEVGSAQGEYQADKWVNLSILKLDNLVLQAPIFALELSTAETQLRSPDKGDLFSASKGTLTYLQLISLLQAKLGEEAISKVMLDDDFRPEKVNKYVQPQLETTPKHISTYPLRPSFMLQTPQPLTEKVSIIHGPERISTGWWDNQAITRDYFIARNQHGQWLWIYRTSNSLWFAHGFFS
ncbi:DNA polymerase Y family protein [Alteromonas sp. M12]|uniref:Y-family DNA polymerase n=1 Tax=Alteromonas sp. M12 TaxID=3135644 RepID=UPI00319E14C0